MTGFEEKLLIASVMNQCNGLQQCEAKIAHDLFGLKSKDNWNVFVFMQVACEQDEDMLFLKNTLGLVVSVLGLAICLIFRNTLVTYGRANMINDKLFDA